MAAERQTVFSIYVCCPYSTHFLVKNMRITDSPRYQCALLLPPPSQVRGARTRTASAPHTATQTALQIPICRSAVLNGYAHVFYNYGIKRHPHRIDAGECFSGDFPVRLPGRSRPPGGSLPAGHGGWGRRFPECSTESLRIPFPSVRQAGSRWSGWGGYTPKRPARRWQ